MDNDRTSWKQLPADAAGGPYERLRAWAHGITVTAIADRLTKAQGTNISQPYVSQILLEDRLPERFVANAIERVTAEWEHGPIRSEEWDEIERARRIAHRAKADAAAVESDTDDARASAA